VIKKKDITAVSNLHLDYESYLGGICDLIGEMVRYATNQAAKGKFSEVVKIKKAAEDIMTQLIDFDMTGYLRTKYDQSRGHLRKLEQMAYEIKLRVGK
jgi:predicted translin family RNA/ssDNA-binding protein